MKQNFRLNFLSMWMTLSVLFVAFIPTAIAQQASQTRSRYDITNYHIEAQLLPDEHMLRAGADITLTPLEATRSLVFELNGSLKVEKIERNGRELSTFIQDSVGVDQLGPNVRVDLGEVVP